MKRLSVCLLVAFAALAMALAGCSQAAPAPAPTKAPEPTKAAAPAATKAPEPTKPAAAPAAPAKAATVDPGLGGFPAKGKTMTIIVPWDAGSGADLIARMVAPEMEKDLGIPVQVVAKPGGGTQLGLTELSKANPDGYTIGMTNQPTTIYTYIDKDRQAVYGRKSFAPIANIALETTAVGVKKDSPFKSMKDLIDAAKAKPGEIRLGDSGLLTSPHLDQLMLAKAAGVKFNPVHFSGTASLNPALLGGHIEAQIAGIGGSAALLKSGEMRLLGAMSQKRVSVVPDVPTMIEQGINVVAGSTRSFSAPGGTPKAIVDRIALAVKRAMEVPEVEKKLIDGMVPPAYMNPEEFAAYWDKYEADFAPIYLEVKAQQK